MSETPDLRAMAVARLADALAEDASATAPLVGWAEGLAARVLDPLLAELDRLRADIAAAEQRGREDNAEHGMCYVYGSKALEAKLGELDALRATVARVEALADEWERAAQKPMPQRAEGESQQDQGVRIGVWHSVKTAAAGLLAALDPA